jgi:uncharacterized protein
MDLVHEPENSRYVLIRDGVFAGEVTYEVEGDLMLLLSTEVPVEMRGEGIGGILVRKTLEALLDEGKYRIQPVCPYIAKFMMQNPEYQALRA